MAADKASCRVRSKFASVGHSHAAGAVGEVPNVRAVTTVADMPEAAAQNVPGEPLERSEHFRTPHSPAFCNDALGASFPSRECQAPRREKKSAEVMW